MNEEVDGTFEKRLEELINIYGLDDQCNTPDYLLADYLIGCLQNYKKIIKIRRLHE